MKRALPRRSGERLWRLAQRLHDVGEPQLTDTALRLTQLADMDEPLEVQVHYVPEGTPVPPDALDATDVLTVLELLNHDHEL